ncbi:hypothetical protein DP092_02810 [Pseudomonas sp. MDMC224]|nr:hypothetical protein DP092_02810 [Pseudomonas sp. MDMC224]
MHRVGRRRFGESLSLGGRATRCKNDWGFAESVKPRSRTDMPAFRPLPRSSDASRGICGAWPRIASGLRLA